MRTIGLKLQGVKYPRKLKKRYDRTLAKSSLGVLDYTIPNIDKISEYVMNTLPIIDVLNIEYAYPMFEKYAMIDVNKPTKRPKRWRAIQHWIVFDEVERYVLQLKEELTE